MKVKILKPIQGYGYFEGDEVEVSTEEGKKFCEAEQAIPLKEIAKETTESKVISEKSASKKKKK